MKDYLSRYTLRVEQELLDKFGYIAEYEGRTKNRELDTSVLRVQQGFARLRAGPQTPCKRATAVVGS